MMGKPQRADGRLFHVGFSLEERVPAEHPLRRIAEVVDFGFVRGRVEHLYGRNGHASADPALVLKLLFLLFYERVRSERELMRQAPLRLDWLWFCGLDLDDPVPDHSVLSKARRRWGLEVFEEVFTHVLKKCAEAGLIDGTLVYADSTVLKADASVDSRVPRSLWRQMEQGLEPRALDEDRTPRPPQDRQDLPPPPSGAFNARTVSATDPDAATTRRRGTGVTLGYRDHTLVDAKHGVVLATIATPADYDDSTMLIPLLDSHKRSQGQEVLVAAADSAYGTAANYDALARRRIKAYLKPRPGRKGSSKWYLHLPPRHSPDVAVRLLTRRQTGAEGRFAEAHVRHEHRRCRWRRRWRVQIQCYLVAAVQNIKKLARWATDPGRALGRRVLAAAGNRDIPAFT